MAPVYGAEKGLEGLVSEWMSLMQERQRIEDAWREDKQVLESTRDGLKAEIKQLNEDIDRARKRSGKWSNEKEEQQQKRKKYEAAKHWLADCLPLIEAKALSYKNKFPVSVLKGNNKLASAIQALENRVGRKDAPKEGLGARMNRIRLILSEATKFSQTLKIVTEDHQYDGEEVTLMVMYLGFSQAYATNKGKTVALRGVCGKDGWDFTKADESADDILQAIQIAKGDGDVEFVSLPTEVK